jgi:molybdopterin converting factor subunit 1
MKGTASENEKRSPSPPERIAVRVRLFAFARERAGTGEVELSLAGPATVADVRRELARQVPALADLVHRMMFAVGARYADDGSIVRAEDDIACIPPVSGG